jgi:hypothetical protein
LLPGLPNSLFYSFELDLVHVAVVSTEAYWIVSNATGESLAGAQFRWLDADLAAVDRAATPWVIVMGHRSLYCSCDDDCTFGATWIREGVAGANGSRSFGMEQLLVKHGVDLWLNGHEHNYERNYPTSNSSLANFTRGGGAPGGDAARPEVVVNPSATTYIVSGCAGDKENHEPFTFPQPAWSAFRSNTFGYGRISVFNASHLLWEAVQTDNGQPATTGSVIDAMMLVVEGRGSQ